MQHLMYWINGSASRCVLISFYDVDSRSQWLCLVCVSQEEKIRKHLSCPTLFVFRHISPLQLQVLCYQRHMFNKRNMWKSRVEIWQNVLMCIQLFLKFQVCGKEVKLMFPVNLEEESLFCCSVFVSKLRD